MAHIQTWQKEIQTILSEMDTQITFKEGAILVIGCSTSEISGGKIGTSGSLEVAEVIFSELQKFAKEKSIHLAFQCCEHLNRALVVERKVAVEKGWEEVSVIPAPTAGGSMATYAYRNFQDSIVVEFIKADVGIDIGDTFIGMHVKHVAVPIRINQRQLGSAHVTIAVTRPKLIGGERAIYK